MAQDDMSGIASMFSTLNWLSFPILQFGVWGICMQRGVEINQLISILIFECSRQQSEGKFF